MCARPIQQEAERIATLVSDLLDLARNDSGQQYRRSVTRLGWRAGLWQVAVPERAGSDRLAATARRLCSSLARALAVQRQHAITQISVVQAYATEGGVQGLLRSDHADLF